MDDLWEKVEVLRRSGNSGENCMVKRVDGSGEQCSVEIHKLEKWGSHDPESSRQIERRLEFEKVKELLWKQGYTIWKIKEDGNCLFRAVAMHVYDDAEQHQKVRDEMVEYIVEHRNTFSPFETRPTL